LKRNLLLFFLITALYSNSLMAGHVLGTELTYQVNSNSTRLDLTLKVYRECTECKLNGVGGGLSTENCSDLPSVVVWGLNQYNEKVLLTQVSLLRVNFQNITTTCKTATDACGNNSNPDFLQGVEVHQLEGTVDLGMYEDQGYCRFYFSTTIFSRSNAIVAQGSATPKFFNFSEYSVCEGIRTSSPVLSTNPFFYINLNSTLTHSPGIVVQDADSISVALVPALSDFDVSINYPNGYTFQRPLQVQCNLSNCTPNPNATIPMGIFLDRETGNTIFYPTFSGQNAVFVYEITKWKKNNLGTLVAVSKVRRDFHTRVYQGNNQQPRLSSLNSRISLCENESFCTNIDAMDTKNTQNLYDSVAFRMLNLSNNMIFSESARNSAPFNRGRFCWSPPSSSSNAYAYFVTLVLQDNNCPLSGVSTFTYKIKVNSSPSLKTSILTSQCGKLTLDATASGFQSSSYVWHVAYPDGTKDTLLGKKHFLQYTQGGKLLFETKIDQYCSGLVKDSVELASFQIPSFTLDSLYAGCKGYLLEIIPGNVSGQNPLRFYWDSKLGNSYALVNPNSEAQYLSLTLVDNLGCSFTDTTKYIAYQKPDFEVLDGYFCSNLEGEFELNSLFKYNSDFSQVHSVHAIQNTLNVFKNEDDWFFDKTDFLDDKVSFRLVFRDLNECLYADTFEIQKLNTAELLLKELGPFCQNSELVDLYAYYGISPTTGIFSSIVEGLIFENRFLDLGVLKSSGTYNLLFIGNNEFCNSEYSLTFKFFYLQALEDLTTDTLWICKNSESLVLDTYNGNATWQGKGVLEGRIFNPASEALTDENSTLLSMSYRHPESSCTAFKSTFIDLKEIPQIIYEGESLDKVYCSSEIPITFEMRSSIENATLSIHSTQADSLISNSLHSYSLYPSANAVRNRSISLNVSLKSQCPEVNRVYDFLLSPNPEITIQVLDSHYCSEETEIRLATQTSNAILVDWYINNTLVKQKASVSSDVFLPNQFIGVNSIQAHVFNESCSSLVFAPNQIFVSETPSPEIVSNPSDNVPVDFNLLKVYDAAQYAHEIVNRNWKVENTVYENTKFIEHKVNTKEGEFKIELWVQDVFGCEGYASSELIVSPPLNLYIPNAFSPNGDGPSINNVFKVTVTEHGSFHMLILNKWGEVIFESKDPEIGWDGTVNGMKCEPGIYAYVIQVENQLGGNRGFKGTLTLLR
jgi:gliding motility-associated-like protein